MKICLIGEFSGTKDEGMRNVSLNLSHYMSAKNQLLLLDLNQFSFKWFKQVKNFKPEIIHYIHGPSIFSLIILKVLCYGKNARTVVSATQPRFNYFSENLIPLVKAQLFLVQSAKIEKMFKNKGCQTKFIFNGVDTEKFHPVTNEKKLYLRGKYGISKNAFVVIHVGSIKKKRNLNVFFKIQSIENVQVIIVGSSSLSVENDLKRKLENIGCLIINDFIENIQEIYQLADCYVFPTKDSKSSIETPLSVLEAMSCNKLVITTEFGGLKRIFKNTKEGLIFYNSDDILVDYIKQFKDINFNISTRVLVKDYSWENITKEILETYLSIL